MEERQRIDSYRNIYYNRATEDAFGLPRFDPVNITKEDIYPDFYNYIKYLFLYRNSHIELTDYKIPPLNPKKVDGQYYNKTILSTKPKMNVLWENSSDKDIIEQRKKFLSGENNVKGNLVHPSVVSPVVSPVVSSSPEFDKTIDYFFPDTQPKKYKNPITGVYNSTDPILPTIPKHKGAYSLKPRAKKHSGTATNDTPANPGVYLPDGDYPQVLDLASYPIASILGNKEYIHLKNDNRPMRNNNPGDLRYANQNKSFPEPTGGDFAAFWTPQDGADALRDQILKYNTYRPGHIYQVQYKNKNGKKETQKLKFLDTIYDFINTLAPPNENDTPKYIAGLQNETGIDPQQHLGRLNHHQLNVLMKAIARQEGIHNGFFDPYIDKASARLIPPLPSLLRQPHENEPNLATQEQQEQTGQDLSVNLMSTILPH